MVFEMGDNTDNGDAQTEILMVNSDYAHIFNINTLDTFKQCRCVNSMDIH
jgi:hypothetical protein